jgi:RNA polymerase sigma-70 factor (ECF subfamily)
MQSARRCSSSSVDAEDVAQEALIRAWSQHESLRDEQMFGAWLRRIVYNEAMRAAQRTRPDPMACLPDSPPGDDPLEELLVSLDLSIALDKLGRDDRLLLELRYRDDLTQAAIAARLRTPEGTIKVRLHRARAKLRELLTAQ